MAAMQIFETLTLETLLKEIQSAGINMLIIDITQLDGDTPLGVVRCCRFNLSIGFRGWIELLYLIENLCDLFNKPMKSHEMRTLLQMREESAEEYFYLSRDERIDLEMQKTMKRIEKLKSFQVDPREKPRKKIASFALRILYRQNSSWQGDFYCSKSEKVVYFRSVLELLHYMVESLELQPNNIFE